VPLDDAAAFTALNPSFHVYAPETSDPTEVFAAPEPDGRAGNSAVFFVLHNSKEGTIWIGESAPDIPSEADRLAFYNEAVAENGHPDIHGTAEIVTIRGGIRALLGTTQDGICTLQWVRKDTEIHLLGPTLTRDQVLEIADEL
jgi:hypothetical protein